LCFRISYLCLCISAPGPTFATRPHFPKFLDLSLGYDNDDDDDDDDIVNIRTKNGISPCSMSDWMACDRASPRIDPLSSEAT